MTCYLQGISFCNHNKRHKGICFLQLLRMDEEHLTSWCSILNSWSERERKNCQKVFSMTLRILIAVKLWPEYVNQKKSGNISVEYLYISTFTLKSVIIWKHQVIFLIEFSVSNQCWNIETHGFNCRFWYFINPKA